MHEWERSKLTVGGEECSLPLSFSDDDDGPGEDASADERVSVRVAVCPSLADPSPDDTRETVYGRTFTPQSQPKSPQREVKSVTA